MVWSKEMPCSFELRAGGRKRRPAGKPAGEITVAQLMELQGPARPSTSKWEVPGVLNCDGEC